MTKRYYVEVKTARSRPYVRACIVRVLDSQSGPTNWHHVRSGVVRQWGEIYPCRGYALDSRYDGPRSSYGRALIEARALADRLNSEA